MRPNRNIWRWSISIVASMAIVALWSSTATSKTQSQMRAMWVWSTRSVLNSSERELFLRSLAESRFTDVYLYLRARDYMTIEAELHDLLVRLRQSGIRAWGMEGWRGYFSDAEGPTGLYAAADALIAFNARHPVGFAGFHSDIEPHDGQREGKERFHNGVAQSRLTPGQLADRDGILGEWLSMHAALLIKMKASGLIYSAAIAAWVDDYEGEPVTATHQGVQRNLMEHLMAVVHDYVIMSYNTHPGNVLRRIEGELRYADLIVGTRPRILFGIETHPGPGPHVSYADTPGKRSRAAVIADYEIISSVASKYSSFAGGAIHDWDGWRNLP